MEHLLHLKHKLEKGSRNTANTKDKAVRACSPPDSKVIDCNLFPGGETYI